MRHISDVFFQSIKIAGYLALGLVLLNIHGCGDEDPVAVTRQTSTGAPGDQTVLVPVGQCTDKTGEAAGEDDPLPNEDCLWFHWDGLGVLTIRHFNTALNCCPEGPAVVTVSAGEGGESGTITIDEGLVGGECDCLCLYDLEFGVSPVVTGIYELTVVNDVVQAIGPNHQLLLELLPFRPCTDIVCIERNQYPWFSN